MTAAKRTGRPLLFDTAEELECRANAYFDDCDTEKDTRVFSHDEIELKGTRRVCCLCGRPERSKGCLLVSGVLKRRRPYTVTIVNDHNDVLTWFKYPHVPYEQQIELMLADLKRSWTDGKPLLGRIVGVRGDSIGQGDMPMEYLAAHSGLPVGEQSQIKFTLQSKNDLYTTFENAIFKEEGDPLRFSYPADHPLTAEFEEQMVRLVREYKGDGEYLSVHHPDEPEARDDAPDATALALFAAKGGSIGEILFV